MTQVVSIINFKGGVGKTTLAIHFATWLASRDESKRVLLIDVDHQSSLSIICMGSSSWKRAIKKEKTVNRVFSSFMGGPAPGAEIICRQPFDDFYPNLDILPARYELDNTEIDLGATVIGNPLHSEWQKRTILCKWLDTISGDDHYDYVVIDCPPATKLVSQNAISASHFYVLPVIPEAVSTRGVPHFRNLVRDGIDLRLQSYHNSVPRELRWRSYVPSTSLGGIVISQARPHGPSYSGYVATHTTQMSELRRLWGDDVLEPIITRHIGVAEALETGWPVYDCTENPNVSGQHLPDMFNRVCLELARKMSWTP